MKQINKGKEPASLTYHRKQEYSDYDNYKEKDDVRISLYIEQRGICCYCMSPIQPHIDYMKIEHFECQEDNPDQQLIYSNLLGACKGNEGEKEANTHCDTFKGRSVLSFYPPSKDYAIQDLLVYSNNGAITSTNKEFDKQLNEVLNLNTIRLKNNRKAALDGFIRGLSNYSELTRPIIRRWINDWKGLNNNDGLKPYCMVIVYWLQKRLNKA